MIKAQPQSILTCDISTVPGGTKSCVSKYFYDAPAQITDSEIISEKFLIVRTEKFTKHFCSLSHALEWLRFEYQNS